MPTTLHRLPTLLPAISRPTILILSTQTRRNFASTPTILAPPTISSTFIAQLSQAESKISGNPRPVQGGPQAVAQSHANQPLTAQIIHDITAAERKITGRDGPVANGPAAYAQSVLTQSTQSTQPQSTQSTQSQSNQSSTPTNNNEPHSGVLDSATISKITDAEKEITGSDDPVRRGPTARAQQHAGEPITSQALHDITEGEKKITGGERVKGGPTSTAQRELGKSRN